MALNKQKVSIPLLLGIDTKSDENQQPPGTLRKLENATFDKPGKIIKRTGYTNVNLLDTSSTTITNTQTLNTFKDELILIANDKLYTRLDSIDQWSQKGSVSSANPITTSLVRNNLEQSNLDGDHFSGVDIIAYEDSNGVSMSLQDSSSSTFLLQDELISASGTLPKVVQRNNEVYIFFLDSNSIKYRKFNIFNFTSIDAEVTPITTVNPTDQRYDAILIDDQIVISFNGSTSGGTLTFTKLDSDDNVASLVEVTGETPTECISLSTDSSFRVICTYASSTEVKIIIYNISLGVKIIPEALLESITGIINVTSIESPTTSGLYVILYEKDKISTFDNLIRIQTIDLSLALGTPAVLARSVGLASKAFTHNSTIYVSSIHVNSIQATYFILDSNGSVVTKFLANNAGDILNDRSLPKVSQINSSTFLLPSQIKGRLVEGSGNTFFSLKGVAKTLINFNPTSKFESSTLGENLHIAGGFLKMYDGATVVEHGFHYFPQSLNFQSLSPTGGFISDGTYQYAAVYSWTDSTGAIHRSAPSTDLQVIANSATSTQQVGITVPNLRLTDKENVIIELYRTEAAGTILYLVSSRVNPTVNDPTLDFSNFLDGTSDADIINNEILYTTGGVLDNIPAPASTITEGFKNRIFTANPGSGKVSYSKLKFEGFPVEFNDALQITLPAKGGDASALKTMDDKLIIFKDNAIYYISGDGPNNLGEQDTFIEPELISSEIGCSNEKSVILTPNGIFFESPKGIYLLNRGLSLSYIGAPVEDFNDLTITSAVLISNKNQIRFTTSDGDALIYNYFQAKWSTFTNHRGVSAVDLNNTYYYLRPDGLLYKESSTYSDNGSYIKTKLESGWLSFAGTQGYQRIYRLLLLGEFKSAHKIKIRIAYNHIDAFIHEEIIDVSDFIDDTAYGQSSPYGSETTYGASNQYQIRLDLKQQKCESIKVSIEDMQDSAGQGSEFSNLLFVIGVKDSEYKINESQQYGTE